MDFRFSGHETFVCRYAWLPKAVREINKNPKLFRDEEAAMVALGVGKNMVRAIRFWAETAQILEQVGTGEHAVTKFGNQLLGNEGYDPYLEKTSTLWLLHWKMSTNPSEPLFFWYQILNHWHRGEFSESEILPFLKKSIPAKGGKRSKSTLHAGYRVFVNTYVPTRNRKGLVTEDNLDSPFVELDFLQRVGDRRMPELGSRETIFAFNLDDKPRVSPALFAYCLHDYWESHYPGEKTLPFHMISSSPGSPGQVFKLPEAAVRRHLELLKRITGGRYVFEESASLQLAQRRETASWLEMLESIFPSED